ncbi:histidine phosphatase family protein [Cellulophaga sp. Hel_I_12]|uniref:SixA phosphatase family protein n=1 Tax=Cellulophaga sp. Hel_I_12 TaxID=1249972 RepID=UPI0006481122|nr:phosphoglycerate mutase family protein [Cellulophaga sp. Hel_I_12]
MKTLILMRHGKSSWDYAVDDADRPLQERGITDAYLVAHKFNQLQLPIDACYSSPANRALHTAMITSKVLNLPLHKFYVTKELYDFSGNSVVEFVKKLDDKLNTVLIFGHNHAFTEIVNKWGHKTIDNLPTAGLVVLNFEHDNWGTIANGKTKTVIVPKQLR